MAPDLAARLAAEIASDGPMPLDRYMARANAHYYATRDPFGAAGDFVTAPEISQMFGELVGLALADLWRRAGAPADAVYVELGPGRGTLAADALRAMRKAGLAPAIHLVETSPLLQGRQRARLRDATWHERIETLPADRPLLIVANEFFDALPVHQFERTAEGWRERRVAHERGGFAILTGYQPRDEAVPSLLRDAPPGSVVELRPAAHAIAAELGRRLAGQGGALLAIDYGHEQSAPGDTLQAVRAHRFVDPLVCPGDSDLTAHVDFEALGAALAETGARVLGPVEQGQWLTSLGISQRAAALVRVAPERADDISAAYHRLTHPEEMGRLFKVLGAIAPGWPALAGFG